MARYLLLAFTAPKPGQDAEYNRWYDETHLNDVLSVEGFRSARRYNAVAAPATVVEQPYLAAYEIEADATPEQIMQRLVDAAPRMKMSEAFDPTGGKVQLFALRD